MSFDPHSKGFALTMLVLSGLGTAVNAACFGYFLGTHDWLWAVANLGFVVMGATNVHNFRKVYLTGSYL